MSLHSPRKVLSLDRDQETDRTPTYGQILKSSSIIGGAQGLNLLIGMVRTKLVALLLGPSGVGLVGLYQSATALLGTLAGLGITKSGVRQIAEAAGSGDEERVGRTVCVLRRTCWLTGFLGMVLTVALARPLSVWTFGNGERAVPMAILGLTFLLGSISGGQMSLIQGFRRISDLARLQVWSAAASTIISIGLYGWLGERGIVPVLLVSALLNLGLSWWFARRVAVPAARVTWGETFTEARGLIGLGLAFMWSGLLAAAVTLATRAMILRGFGMEANGIYQAAWGISGLFAGFILGAMGADFYPRLTEAAHDNCEVNRLVNEQTEVGMLLALPGLLGTLVFSPLVIRIFYSAKFTEAAELLPWFLLGVWGRVVSWPLGYIQLAKGAARWFAVTETVFSLLHLGMVWAGLRGVGLKGAAVAYAALYGLYILGMLWAAARLSDFRWSRSVALLFLAAASAVVATFILMKFAPDLPARILGGFLVLCSGFYCVRQICRRLGTQHRLSRMVLQLPLIGQRLAG